MYCHQCGEAANGNFCASCGTSLRDSQSAAESAAPFSLDEVRYAVIIQSPDVRQAIADFSSDAKCPLSGERFLEICDLALAPASGLSLKTLASIAHPLSTKLGLRTGKQRTVEFPAPAAPVLISVLCSLARRAQPIREVTQRDDGCLIVAAIPSDFRSLEADLSVEVKRADDSTRIKAATNIQGQITDWGKSKQVLNTFFSDIAQALAGFSDDARAA